MYKPLISNTQVVQLVKQFYRKIPDYELARTITRLTGLNCLPRDIWMIARTLCKDCKRSEQGKVLDKRYKQASPEAYQASLTALDSAIKKGLD